MRSAISLSFSAGCSGTAVELGCTSSELEADQPTAEKSKSASAIFGICIRCPLIGNISDQKLSAVATVNGVAGRPLQLTSPPLAPGSEQKRPKLYRHSSSPAVEKIRLPETCFQNSCQPQARTIYLRWGIGKGNQPIHCR